MELTNFQTISGSDTHVVLEFPYLAEYGVSPYLYMGSVITLSYSVYRQKTPVFNCGDNLISGFAMGNKYVAGSFITTVNHGDEITEFLNNLRSKQLDDENAIRDIDDYLEASGGTGQDKHYKSNHSFMRDDLTEFNIHVIFTSEYGKWVSSNRREPFQSRITIYGANFINNGQQMSINDLITEGTMSYVARDIRELHTLDFKKESQSITHINTVSNLLKKKHRAFSRGK